MKKLKFVVMFFVTLMLNLTVVHTVPVFASQTSTQVAQQSAETSLADLAPLH